MQQASVLDQLEDALASESLARRADILRRVTDLFFIGAGTFTREQVHVFGEVMEKLLDGVELQERILLGQKLARSADAPVNVVRQLAFDASAEVAAPILTYSACLDDDTLVENAQTMSQLHLLAIAKRSVVRERVTDVLVDRGDDLVVASLAENVGSRFSESGLARLVDRSGSDERIARFVWARRDVPRRELARLFQAASEELKKELGQSRPSDGVRTVVDAASENIQSAARKSSLEYADAHSVVSGLIERGMLNEASLSAFAEAGAFARAAVALAHLSDLPVGIVERVLLHDRPEQLLIVAKAIDLSWPTVKSLLNFRLPGETSVGVETDDVFVSFARLKTSTAKTANCR